MTEAAPSAAPSGEIETDLTDWPVMVVRPPERVTDAQMSNYLHRTKALRAARPERHAMVIDLRRNAGITPTQRKMLTDDMAAPEHAAVQARCVGVAMVFDSAFLRGILTAIFWVRKPPYPTQVFRTVAEAKTWAKALLAAPAA